MAVAAAPDGCSITVSMASSEQPKHSTRIGPDLAGTFPLRYKQSVLVNKSLGLGNASEPHLNALCCPLEFVYVLVHGYCIRMDHKRK